MDELLREFWAAYKVWRRINTDNKLAGKDRDMRAEERAIWNLGCIERDIHLLELGQESKRPVEALAMVPA